MGRDIRAVLRFQVPLTFQSTRPRGARLFHAPKFGGFVVSIHAPTWGATDIHRHTPRQSSRFNPRAHVGRDYVNFINDKPIGSFNPRAHVGRDCSADTILRAIEVSIHAPTWGATFCCARNMYNKMFQSTRPRGARQIWGRGKFRKFQVSIHAPTWGATANYAQTVTRHLFQSTRPRGARQMPLPTPWPRSLFQSTRPRGARPIILAMLLGQFRFNPRAHVGRDCRIRIQS